MGTIFNFFICQFSHTKRIQNENAVKIVQSNRTAMGGVSAEFDFISKCKKKKKKYLWRLLLVAISFLKCRLNKIMHGKKNCAWMKYGFGEISRGLQLSSSKLADVNGDNKRIILIIYLISLRNRAIDGQQLIDDTVGCWFCWTENSSASPTTMILTRFSLVNTTFSERFMHLQTERAGKKWE